MIVKAEPDSGNSNGIGKPHIEGRYGPILDIKVEFKSD
jgi:hypothetical protein